MISILRSRRATSADQPRRHSGATRAGRALVLVGALAVAGGLAIAPSVAAGESTTAVLTSPLSGTSKTFTWTYEFHAGDGHDLSNIAVAFCSTDILAHVVSASPSGETFLSGDVPGGHTAFGPGVKFDTTAVTGTLTVVFDQAYAPGGILQVQSHSGDGQAGDLITTAAGPGDCAPTTTTTVPATTTTVPATTTTVPVTVPATTTTVPATTTTVPATTTTVPATTTTVPATTTTVATTTSTTAPATTTTTVAVLGTVFRNTTTTVALTTSTSVPTSVLGNRFVNDDPADLAKTGFNGGPLVAFGALCLALGAVLLVSGRRELSFRN